MPRNVVNPDGPLYARKDKAGPNLARLQLGEEPLNDQFNLTFAIAADVIVSELLFEKVGILDLGPFEKFLVRQWANVSVGAKTTSRNLMASLFQITLC